MDPCYRCYAAAAVAAAMSLQSCLTLCNPTDGSPPGSPVPGILQARTLEWVAISFSNDSDDAIRVQMIQREHKGGIYHFSLENEEGRLEKTELSLKCYFLTVSGRFQWRHSK